MSDPRRIVENIRVFMTSGAGAAAAPIAAVAVDYAELCRDANLRLQRCAEFLHEGLVGEAVEFAAVRPPLLELIATLDFQEVPAWEQACAQMGMARAARLELNTAIMLNAARERHEPIKELLGRYRYLALARAPLTERLTTAWRLAAADPSSVIWRQEAEELEKSRLIQLRVEASAAMEANDVQQMDKLLLELGVGRWQAFAALELKETLHRAVTGVRYAGAISRLNATVPKVREAFAAKSLEQCQAVFAQWGKIVKESRVVVPVDLRQHILPLAHWIDEEEERRAHERKFRSACSQLLDAVKRQAPVEEIKECYRAVAAFESPIPQDVAAAYDHGVETARLAKAKEQKKQYALAAALVGAIVAALGTLTFVIFNGGKR
ncbi:MAG TPA: hypothetical protein VG326_17610 [Tepidisphaeraceae bacterium]|jgi:hypothetical protein|nr:hypothetical protein [Tepidisphaeraceae bacterium]